MAQWWNNKVRKAVDIVNLVLLVILLAFQIFILVFTRITKFKFYLGRNTCTIATVGIIVATILNILLVINNASVWWGGTKLSLIATLDEIFDSVIMVSLLMIIARFSTVQLIRNILKKTHAPKRPIAITSIVVLIVLAIVSSLVIGLPKIILVAVSKKNPKAKKAATAISYTWEVMYALNMIAIIICAVAYTALYVYKRVTDDAVDQTKYYMCRVVLLDVIVFFFSVFVCLRVIVSILKLKLFDDLMSSFSTVWPFSITRLLTFLVLLGMTIVLSPLVNKTNFIFGPKPKSEKKAKQAKTSTTDEPTSATNVDSDMVDVVMDSVFYYTQEETKAPHYDNSRKLPPPPPQQRRALPPPPSYPPPPSI